MRTSLGIRKFSTAVVGASIGLGLILIPPVPLAQPRDLPPETPKYWREAVKVHVEAVTSWIALADDDAATALELAQAAADREDAVDKHPVTPGEVLPARELFADMLLQLGRGGDARDQYLVVLENSPNRLNALLGAAEASVQLGGEAEAADYYRTALQQTASGNQNRPRLKRAKAFVSGWAGHANAEQLVISNGNLIDGRTGAVSRAVDIVVEDGVIASVQPAARTPYPRGAGTIDASGKWVMPGIIDVHVHNRDPAYLAAMLTMGVTSIHLMPNHPPDEPASFMRQTQDPEHRAPRAHLSAMFTKSFPDNIFPGVYEFQKPTDADHARKQVEALFEQGYRSVKIIQDDSTLWAGDQHAAPMLSDEEFAAIIETAHANDMRVFIHSSQRDVTREAVTGDGLMHGTMDFVLEDSIWRDLNGNNVGWTPAFSAPLLFGDFPRYAQLVLSDQRVVDSLSPDDRAQHQAWASSDERLFAPGLDHLNRNLDSYLSIIAKNTELARAHGVTIAVGTDGGPGGASTHIEMELMSSYGLPAADVLVAATWGGAVLLGIEDEAGVVEPGRPADLILLNTNPLEDIRNTRDIDRVLKGGVPYLPQRLEGDEVRR